MKDFNTITEKQEQEAIAKFKEYGKGVVMGKYIANLSDDNSSKWADLIDPTKFSNESIKQKMLEIARLINTTCNDAFLGDLTVAFTTRDHKDKRITFSHLEMYLFLRGALRFRKEAAEYKAKAKKLAELTQFIDENKSVDQKRKEAIAEAKKLEKELA